MSEYNAIRSLKHLLQSVLSLNKCCLGVLLVSAGVNILYNVSSVSNWCIVESCLCEVLQQGNTLLYHAQAVYISE